jgi:regulator of sirC expression with transglutaminase-like and TPR domain
VDPTLERRFAEFGRDAAATELTGALLVAALLDPGVDEAGIRADIATLAGQCGALAPWDFLLHRGFRGNFEDYQSLDNSHLGRVLQSGRGLPITLAVLLIEVAHAVGRPASGINFPGHFLVRVGEQLVDPFAMEPLLPEDAVARLPPAERRRPLTELLPPTTAQALALRMLNNVKSIFAGRAAWHRALEAVDAQLAIAPDQPVVQLERGELWLRMGSVASAREAFNAALVLVGGADSVNASPAIAALKRHIRQRIAALDGSGDVLH